MDANWHYLYCTFKMTCFDVCFFIIIIYTLILCVLYIVYVCVFILKSLFCYCRTECRVFLVRLEPNELKERLDVAWIYGALDFIWIWDVMGSRSKT